MPNDVTQEHFDRTIADLKADQDAKFVTKNEFHTRMDEAVSILKRLGQERIFTIEWICRIEGDVSHIKNHLKIA